MIDELSDIAPVQFMEGINENEQPFAKYEMHFFKLGKKQVAIPYIPTRTYTLKQIAIYGVKPPSYSQEKHSVYIYTDNNNEPSNNLLSKGQLQVPDELSEDWPSIELSPIVIFARQMYWITIAAEALKFVIVPDRGKAFPVKTRAIEDHPITDGKQEYPWESSEEVLFMMKFYGRVLPIATTEYGDEI